MVESSKAVGPWREAVRAETQRVMQDHFQMNGPVAIEVTFSLPRPAGHFGTGKNYTRVKASAPAWPAGRPDLDKLLRAVLDGLTMGGAWKDDAQVVQAATCKQYAGPALVGCLVEIGPLERTEGDLAVRRQKWRDDE